jgi:hypothetical protein
MIDYGVHLPCSVKNELGDGDPMVGEDDLLRRLKSLIRMKALEKVAKERGNDVRTMSATFNEVHEITDPCNVEVRYTDLQSHVAPLRVLQRQCTGCPANALQRAFGCQGGMKYPIRKKTEQWLMHQVQMMDSPAGPYLALAIEDGDRGLAQIRHMRQQHLFESPQPIHKMVGCGRRSKAEIDSDSVFETFLARDKSLDPDFCVMLLLAFAAIALDGRPATSAEGFSTVFEMTNVEERNKRTTFAFPPDPDLEILGLQFLLRAMYYAWRNNVQFLIRV